MQDSLADAHLPCNNCHMNLVVFCTLLWCSPHFLTCMVSKAVNAQQYSHLCFWSCSFSAGEFEQLPAPARDYCGDCCSLGGAGSLRLYPRLALAEPAARATQLLLSRYQGRRDRAL